MYNLKKNFETIKVYIRGHNLFDIFLPEFDFADNKIGKINLDYVPRIEIIKKQITEISNSETYDDMIKSKKEELDRIAIELYGVNPETNQPYTQKESIEKGTGVYGVYINAKNNLDNDEFNQLEKTINTLDEASANYDNIREYSEYESKKQQTTFSSPAREVVMDNEGNPLTTIVRTKNRNTQEVPQTVYDIIGFINGMKKLTTEYPYVMQVVTGLDEAYKNYFYNHT